MAAEFLVMNLKIPLRPALLAPPVVASKNFLA
jgi:hypothetical protein